MRHRSGMPLVAACALALAGCVTPRLWDGVGAASTVVAAPAAVPARVAVAADGVALVVAIAAAPAADPAAAAVSRWEPVDGFADALAAVLAAPGERTLTVLAFVDDEGAGTERRALLAAVPVDGERLPPAPLRQAPATASVAAGAPVPCALTWEVRRTGDAGVSTFDVAWRVAVTPGAVAVDTVILAGCVAVSAVLFPVAIGYGLVSGEPGAAPMAAALLGGF